MTEETYNPVWEYFCDASYYHMGCVRQIAGSKFFSEGFHCVSLSQARRLCGWLNTADAGAGVPVLTLEPVKDPSVRFVKLIHTDGTHVTMNTREEADGVLAVFDVYAKEQHKLRHVFLHKCFDELVADFVTHTEARPSQTDLLTLGVWSYKQTQNPTEKK